MKNKTDILKSIDELTIEINALEVNIDVIGIDSRKRNDMRKKVLVLTGHRRKLNEDLMYLEQSSISKGMLIFVSIIIASFVLLGAFLFLGN